MIVVSEELTQEHALNIYEDNKGLASFLFFKLIDDHLEQIKFATF